MTPNDVVIQIVDDHPTSALGLMAALAGLGFHFLDPILRAEDVSSDATVVVLDLHLSGGGLSGSSAVSFITSKLKPVVATSGAVGVHVIADAFASGALAFIDKKVTVPEVWKDVLLAASQHLRLITAHTAAALLTDADWRTILPAENDFTAEARQFLQEILEAADDKSIRERYRVESKWVKDVSDHIWRVTSERKLRWNIPIPPVLEPVVPLLYSGLGQKEAGYEAGIPHGTIRDALGRLKGAVEERAGYTASPLSGKPPMSIFRFFVRNRDEDLGTSDGAPIPRDTEPRNASNSRKKAPRK